MLIEKEKNKEKEEQEKANKRQLLTAKVEHHRSVALEPPV
jgi:hypothetical protein